MNILRGTGDMPQNLVPAKNGLRDHLDLWEKSSLVRHAGTGHKMRALALKGFRTLTGLTVVPNISLGIRKEKTPKDGVAS